MEINLQLGDDEKKINLGGFPPIFKISGDLKKKKRI